MEGAVEETSGTLVRGVFCRVDGTGGLGRCKLVQEFAKLTSSPIDLCDSRNGAEGHDHRGYLPAACGASRA